MAMLQPVEAAKTHEIMARFRPIAPKPTLPQIAAADPSDKPSTAVALHLQSRPCRTRKRGRASLAPLPASKRPRTFLPLLPASATGPSPTTAQSGFSVQRFTSRAGTGAGGGGGRPLPVVPFSAATAHCKEHNGRSCGDLLTLSLLPCAPTPERGIPVERDLLQKLQQPKVIVPQPVRPVGSSISVGPINPKPNSCGPPVAKKPEEVEEEVESDALPAVVSDSRNRVRLTNTAYKEMVGQPECRWLDSMVHGGNGLGMKPMPSRRINGEVMLELGDSSALPTTSNGFSCRVKIEWARDGTKTFVSAPCDVTRLFCESEAYVFAWRFHTAEASVTHCNA